METVPQFGNESLPTLLRPSGDGARIDQPKASLTGMQPYREPATPFSKNLSIVTPFFFTNAQNQKLHIKWFLPKDINADTIVSVCAHGYGFHCNTTMFNNYLRKYVEGLNTIIVAYDFPGHGYSEGKLGAVDNFEDLVSGHVNFIRLLLTAPQPKADENETSPCGLGDYNLCASAEFLADIQKRKLVLSGESMGGAISVMAAVRLQGTMHEPRALIMMAPCLQAKNAAGVKLPARMEKLFEYSVRRMDRLAQIGMPGQLVPALEGKTIVGSDPIAIEICDLDRAGDVKGALGYRKKMTASTTAAFTEMFRAMPAIIAKLEIPFRCFQDPQDSYVDAEAVRQLTKLAKSSDKKFIDIVGGLHAPHFNKQEEVMQHMQEFYQTLFCRGADGPRSEAIPEINEAVPEINEAKLSLSVDEFVRSFPTHRMTSKVQQC